MISITKINAWYEQPLGKSLLQSEIIGLASVLPKMFGYYILQIGGPINNNEILASSCIHNRIIINPSFTSNHHHKDTTIIQAQPDKLPFLPDSLDVIVIFHALEFSRNPKTILKEIYTALIPGGHAIIFSFNRYSLWGINHLYQNSKEIPWTKTWIKPSKMRTLLSDADFSVNDYKTFYFRPPRQHTEKLFFLEGIGQLFWPYWGASYMFVAQKIVTGLTPIRLQTSTKHFKIVKSLPKPVSRVSQ